MTITLFIQNSNTFDLYQYTIIVDLSSKFLQGLTMSNFNLFEFLPDISSFEWNLKDKSQLINEYINYKSSTLSNWNGFNLSKGNYIQIKQDIVTEKILSRMHNYGEVEMSRPKWLVEYLSLLRLLEMFFGWGAFCVANYVNSKLCKKASSSRNKRILVSIQKVKNALDLKRYLRVYKNCVASLKLAFSANVKFKGNMQKLNLYIKAKDFFNAFFKNRNYSLANLNLDLTFGKVIIMINLLKLNWDWNTITFFFRGYNRLNRKLHDLNINQAERKMILAELVNNFRKIIYMLSVPYISNLVNNEGEGNGFYRYIQDRSIDIDRLRASSLYSLAIYFVIENNKHLLKCIEITQLYKIAISTLVPSLLKCNPECMYYLLKIIEDFQCSVANKKIYMKRVILHYHPDVEFKPFLVELQLYYPYLNMIDGRYNFRLNFPSETGIVADDWYDLLAEPDNWDFDDYFNSSMIVSDKSNIYSDLVWDQETELENFTLDYKTDSESESDSNSDSDSNSEDQGEDQGENN